MEGFKSFGPRTVTVQLSSGFTCIVGPNGAGKSNIIDALCFALGRLSKKTMRAKSLEDLIFAGSRNKKAANRAKVTLFFDNSEGLFPGGKETDFTISRTIKRGGGGGYKMNSKTSTRTAILNALATANIDPDGTNQFVLQGKIVELTHMNPENRREFIEDLIGLSKYDEMKDATMKELEKAERDLGQFEAIFKEVSTQLKKVEKEKNDALAWKALDDDIKHYNAQLIALKISKLQKEEDELDKKIEESSKIIEELEEKINKQEDVLKQEALVMDNLQTRISEREEEREAISENITQLKTKLSSFQTELNLAKQSIDKLNSDKTQLEKMQMELEEGQTYDGLIEETSNDISKLEEEIEDTKQDIETRQQNQADLEGKIKDNEDEKAGFNKEISSIKQNISSNKSRIKVLKQNIKKNDEKRTKLEEELKKLKGEAESIDDAMEEAKKQESEKREEIESLKQKVAEENQKQKDLENQINSVQAEKNALGEKLSDLNSSLSAINTEIKMNKKNIDNQSSRKEKISKKIQELSKGKDSEVALKELMAEKNAVSKELEELRNKSKEEDSIYKKNEHDLDLTKMKMDSIDSEINDHNSKIANINTELKLFKKELTNLEREKRNLDMSISSMTGVLSKNEKEIETLNTKKDNVTRRLKELNTEKEHTIKRIESSDEEYDRNAEDVTGILSILNMLTQNINVSVESIKGNIQQSNAEAIEHSAGDFKTFILDIIDIMKTLETLECEADKVDEMEMMLNSITQTLDMFTENADSTIEQLIHKVKESSDVAVQESTMEFDSFVQDLMEILENVHLSLRKLTLSKSQELYKQLDEISQNIKSQQDELNDIEKKLNGITLENKHNSDDLTKSSRRLEEVTKRIEELTEKTSKYDKEIEDREKNTMELESNKEKLNSELEEKKKIKDNYWEKISEFQTQIDVKQEELEQVQEKLQELQGIQNLYENIEEIDANIENLNAAIEEKKQLIIDTEASIQKVQEEQSALQEKIDGLSQEKEKFWEKTARLQEQIDDENKNLEEIVDRLRALENVMRIINNIEELKKENEDAGNNIEESNKEIEEFNSQVEEIQTKVDEKQAVIDDFRKQKEDEVAAQKEAQKQLNKRNKDLQKVQGRLNELNKNKEREQQIIALGEDIKETEIKVEGIVEKIEKIEGDLQAESEKKDAKQEEIDQLVVEKDDSWNKQKQYQKVLGDLKSDLSMENSKMNNFESKKIICNDQIETLYERSKDYGALPPVTDELSEEGLQSDIAVASKKKKALEPVNLKAIEQYDVVKERFDEIDMRRQTIQRERKSILDAIEKIELEKTRTFMKAYHEINREFSGTFQKLSPGGSAKMILDRPDKPFEGGVSIEARPRGKKISSLEILSGGEKTLVALSFIFAVQEFYPAPFYIMDEIDAALDGPNVHRVSMVIKEFASQAQFLVISHREENIVNSDRIYGVSMQQSGITDIFSVDLQEEAKRLLDTEDTAQQIEGL